MLLEDSQTPELTHLEAQSTTDPGLAQRVPCYSVLLYGHHQIPVHSVIVLLRREADHPSLDGKLRYHRKKRRGRGRRQDDVFEYTVIRLWQWSVQRFLQGSPWTLPLAVLADLGSRDLADVLRQAVQKILATWTLQDPAEDAEEPQEHRYTHVHLQERFPIELTLHPEEKASYVFKSSITGKAIERGSIAQLEALLSEEDPQADLEAELDRAEDHLDRFELYRTLLEPLAEIRQSRRYHPEGDAMYHSLQVFTLAEEVRGYDEEFLTAALLHDVGKAIDPLDHV